MYYDYKSSKCYIGDRASLYKTRTRLVLNAKCLTFIRNYHTMQSEVENRLAYRNNLHIGSIKQFSKESVNREIQ